MTFAEMQNDETLTNRYKTAWAKIGQTVKTVNVEHNALITDEEALKLRELLSDNILAQVRPISELSLDDAFRYLEGIANNPDDCYYCAREALNYAVRKFEDVLGYIVDRNCIRFQAVANYAVEQWMRFINFEMNKTQWEFENDREKKEN